MSSVTDMSYIFTVRSARALPGPCSLESGHPRARRVRCRRPTPSHPASHARLLTRQNTPSLSDANKLLIRCVWAGNSAFASAGYGESWAPNCYF